MSAIFQPLNPHSNGHPGADSPDDPDRWHDRGYLPHFDGHYIPQAITFRMNDSLPKNKLDQWERELCHLERSKQKAEKRKRIESYLDKGRGKAWLKKPRIAEVVEKKLLYFDGDHYHLHAWVIMPNHVHVLVTFLEEQSLSEVVKGWKSVSTRKINKILGRSGSFWQRGYFDRYMRDKEHFWATFRYIEYNPVKAGLCSEPSDWKWGSAYFRGEEKIEVLKYDKFNNNAGEGTGAPGGNSGEGTGGSDRRSDEKTG